VGSSELGPIYRRIGHPSSCRPRHTDRVVERRSEEPPLAARPIASVGSSRENSADFRGASERQKQTIRFYGDQRFESPLLQRRVRDEPLPP
jgi:hypothetical protein